MAAKGKPETKQFDVSLEAKIEKEKIVFTVRSNALKDDIGQNDIGDILYNVLGKYFPEPGNNIFDNRKKSPTRPSFIQVNYRTYARISHDLSEDEKNSYTLTPIKEGMVEEDGENRFLKAIKSDIEGGKFLQLLNEIKTAPKIEGEKLNPQYIQRNYEFVNFQPS